MIWVTGFLHFSFRTATAAQDERSFFKDCSLPANKIVSFTGLAIGHAAETSVEDGCKSLEDFRAGRERKTSYKMNLQRKILVI